MSERSRAPAHQNSFAFKHNPNSKKTKKIAAIPNVGVCKRCHDIIEWRKKYRKVSAAAIQQLPCLLAVLGSFSSLAIHFHVCYWLISPFVFVSAV